MKIKSILAGITAFVFAGGIVYGFNKELQTPNGSYIHPTLGCIAVHVEDCVTPPTPEPCEEDVLGDEVLRQIYENETKAPEGQASICEQPLFRLAR